MLFVTFVVSPPEKKLFSSLFRNEVKRNKSKKIKKLKRNTEIRLLSILSHDRYE